jgi:hypothetical protein
VVLQDKLFNVTKFNVFYISILTTLICDVKCTICMSSLVKLSFVTSEEKKYVRQLERILFLESIS